MHLLRTLARGGVAPVVRRTVPVTTPAAGVGWSLTPDNGRFWQVQSITATLATSSQAANRTTALTLSDGSSTLWSIPPVAVQTASLTYKYSWIADYPTPTVTVVGLAQAMPLPPAILAPGWSLACAVGAIDSGDQFTAIVAEVLEAFAGDTEAEYDIARAAAHHFEALSELFTQGVPGI